MKNNHESAQNPSPDRKKPDIQEEDIESLLQGFEAADAAKAEAQPAKEPTYEELLAEAEESMNKDIAASKSLDDKNILKNVAELASASAINSHLEALKGMLNRPEDVAKLLLAPVNEMLRETLDPSGGFKKKQENEQVRALYARFDHKARLAAHGAMVKELGARIDAATDPAEISALNKILEAVEAADPGATEE